MSFRFVGLLNKNQDVFFTEKAALGFVWAGNLLSTINDLSIMWAILLYADKNGTIDWQELEEYVSTYGLVANLNVAQTSTLTPQEV